MRKFLRDNGLSIVLAALFLAFLAGQSFAGWLDHNEERRQHGGTAVDYGEYLLSPHFLEATMENFESEFLQMFAYVLLTAYLFQRGSSESKDPDTPQAVDRDPRLAMDERSPWPVKKGGLILKLYENSLCIAFFVLFALSIFLHAYGGAGVQRAQQALHGEPQQVTTLSYMATSKFWFESLQNWQSEFLALASMVLLSIWLRQKGSPESKPVDAAHDETGDE